MANTRRRRRQIRHAALAILAGLWLLACPTHAATRRLTLATWDFGWLTLRPAGDPALPDHVTAKRPEDLARLSRYAEALQAGVIAIQGVDGQQAAAALFAPAAYKVHLTEDAVLQRSGFAVRVGTPVEANPDLASLDPFAHARLRLRSGADVTLALSPHARLRLLSVQLKSGCRDLPLDDVTVPACATLRRQADALHDWIAARTQAGEAFAILGDFARVMDGDSSFMARLAPQGALVRATQHYASPCWGGGNFVDHILLGGAARGWLVPGSLQVLAYREQGDAWRERLSAHCPVSVQLDVPP